MLAKDINVTDIHYENERGALKVFMTSMVFVVVFVLILPESVHWAYKSFLAAPPPAKVDISWTTYEFFNNVIQKFQPLK